MSYWSKSSEAVKAACDIRHPLVVLQVTAIIQILGGKLEICGTQKGGF